MLGKIGLGQDEQNCTLCVHIICCFTGCTLYSYLVPVWTEYCKPFTEELNEPLRQITGFKVCCEKKSRRRTDQVIYRAHAGAKNIFVLGLAPFFSSADDFFWGGGGWVSPLNLFSTPNLIFLCHLKPQVKFQKPRTTFIG